ncbi:MAG: peptidoglycan recognition family protein [Eubacteriales bacterium]|jgi:N-acetylmuramoyl-L-alanine amidase
MTRQERIKQLHRHITIAAVTAGAVVALVAVAAVRGYPVPGAAGKSNTASAQETTVDASEAAASQAGSQIAALTSSTASAKTSSGTSSDTKSGTTSTSVSESEAAAIANAVNPTTVQAEIKNTDGSLDPSDYESHLAKAVSDPADFWSGAPLIDVQMLDINPYSRPGGHMYRVDDIVVHSTDSPNAPAQNIHDYFESLTDGSRSASSHFIVGLNGEIIQCIPIYEKSYATKWRNYDTISIEMCPTDEEGHVNDATYQSTVQLVAWLQNSLGLSSSHVIRHYDATGKVCPRYFANNPDAWTQMVTDIGSAWTTISSSGGRVS